MFTMRPARPIISGATSRQTRTQERRFRSITARRSSTEINTQSFRAGRPPPGPVAPAGPMSPPALFTRTSIRPSSARIFATAAPTSPGSVRSAQTVSTRRPVSAATSRPT
jgi:hypothetical protein